MSIGADDEVSDRRKPGSELLSGHTGVGHTGEGANECTIESFCGGTIQAVEDKFGSWCQPESRT